MTTAGKLGIGNTTSLALGRLPLVGVLPGGDEVGVTRTVTASHPFIKAGDVPLLDFPAWSEANQQVYLRGIYCTDGVLNIEVAYIGVEELDVSAFTIGVGLARSVGFPGQVARTGLPNMGPQRQLGTTDSLGNLATGAIAAGADGAVTFDASVLGTLDNFVFPNFSAGTLGLCLSGWAYAAGVFTARVINVTAAPITLLPDELSVALLRVVSRSTPPGAVASAAGGPSSSGPEDYWWLTQTGPAAPAAIVEAGVLVDIPTNAKLPAIPVGATPIQAFTWRALPTPGRYGINAAGFGASGTGWQCVLQSLATTGAEGTVAAESVFSQTIRRLH